MYTIGHNFITFFFTISIFSETFEEGARREAREETGLTLKDFAVHTLVNCFDGEKNYHYITIVTSAQIDLSVKQEPENLEPEKCEGIELY